jgi:hypothetical protein
VDDEVVRERSDVDLDAQIFRDECSLSVELERCFCEVGIADSFGFLRCLGLDDEDDTGACWVAGMTLFALESSLSVEVDRCRFGIG